MKILIGVIIQTWRYVSHEDDRHEYTTDMKTNWVTVSHKS